MIQSFGNIYRDKRVLITGHTGFKGSLLSIWLLELGAQVAGYSLYIPSTPSNFEVLNLEKRLKRDVKGDIKDFKSLEQVFDDFLPEIVFHLAAQAITLRSYKIPQETFYTNIGGTINVLECIRRSKSIKTAVIITSDKCYKNVEWVWGYRENDALGGDDPYSASKACAEIVCHSYIKSFFSKSGSPRISTTRAGNVIGGGDWADHRIIPDCIRAFSIGKTLEIRNPKAIRPWQHVFEPLSGYLWLGANLLQNNEKIVGESFNFGPLSHVHKTVEDLIVEFAKIWGECKWSISNTNNTNKKEVPLLRLTCDKSLQYLKWHASLSFEEMVRMTASWYKAFYNGKVDMYNFTTKQIEEYTNRAQSQGLMWTK